MKCLAVPILTFLILAAPRPVEANLFSDTGHSPKQETFENPALRSVGRLFFDGETKCTATLVDTDLIVTAAHCVVDVDGKGRVNADHFTFITGAKTESQGTRFPIDSNAITVGTFEIRTETELDVAFLRLATPVDALNFPPARIEPLSSSSAGERKYLTGYYHLADSSLDNTPTTEECEVVEPLKYGKDPSETLFSYNCSTTPGMSGAPYYAIRNGHVVILGIHSGSAHELQPVLPAHYTAQLANRAADGYVAMEVLAQFRKDHP
jgi:hypothetical protein